MHALQEQRPTYTLSPSYEADARGEALGLGLLRERLEERRVLEGREELAERFVAAVQVVRELRGGSYVCYSLYLTDTNCLTIFW